MRVVHTILLLICAVVFAAACGDCRGGPGQIEEKRGDELPFEAIPLGIDRKTFLKKAVALSGLDNVDINTGNACRDQLTMSVPDLDGNTVVERPRGPHALSNCVVRTAIAAQNTSLIELRGEFIGNRLARLSFRMKPDELSKLRQNIEGRFGAGAKVVLTEKLVVEEKKVDYQIWQEEGEIWLLSKGETGTALFVHQDRKGSESLPDPPKAAERGEPVSLEDLGIGKLDLNAPMPRLDLPDSGL